MGRTWTRRRPKCPPESCSPGCARASGAAPALNSKMEAPLPSHINFQGTLGYIPFCVDFVAVLPPHHYLQGNLRFIYPLCNGCNIPLIPWQWFPAASQEPLPLEGPFAFQEPVCRFRAYCWECKTRVRNPGSQPNTRDGLVRNGMSFGSHPFGVAGKFTFLHIDPD